MRTILCIALLSTWSTVQAKTAPADPVAPKAVSFEDILKWVSQGKDAPTILESCDTIFVFNFQETEKLRKAGAADALIDALQKKRMKLGDVRNVVVILDCSGSMSDKMPDGRTKMETAKKVVSDLIDAIPAGRSLSFIVYGHDLKLACDAVQVVRPLGPLENEHRAPLQKIIAGLEPIGHTPIAKSLQTASIELDKAKGICQVVLITDGEETCKGDPAKVAEQLAMRENLRAVEVVGLGLTPKEQLSVANIAKRGRGKFYDSQTAKDLEDHLKNAVPVKPPVEIAKKDPEPPKKDVVKKEEPKEPETPRKVEVPADLPKSVRNLITALTTDEDAKTRTTAAEALAAFKTPPAVSTVVAALCEALKDKDGRVRRMAADSLGKIGDVAAANALVKRITDEVWVAYPSGSFNYDPNDPPPFDAGGKEWGSKDHALKALKKLARDQAPGALAVALKSKNDALRAWAAARMEGEKGDLATKSLIEALNDKDGQVRRAAADSLGKIGDKSKEVVEALVDRVGDAVWLPRPKGTISFNPDDPPAYDDEKDWGSKHHAIQALRKLAPDRIDEALAGAVVSKSPDVKKWAIQMIGKEKGKNP